MENGKIVVVFKEVETLEEIIIGPNENKYWFFLRVGLKQITLLVVIYY